MDKDLQKLDRKLDLLISLLLISSSSEETLNKYAEFIAKDYEKPLSIEEFKLQQHELSTQIEQYVDTMNANSRRLGNQRFQFVSGAIFLALIINLLANFFYDYFVHLYR